MEGFIFIHRELRNHWIWEHPEKLKWWLDILLTVNFEDNEKVNIGYQLFECNRGQSLLSLSSWANRWNVSKDTARNFIKLLEKDKMITLENLEKTTRLTVCNYEKYQTSLHAKHTQSKRNPNAKPTQSHSIKERKEREEGEERKENTFNFKNALIEIGVTEQIASDWMAVRKTKKATNTQTAFIAIKKQIEISGRSANACIEHAVTNNWSGFKAEWMQPVQPQQPVNMGPAR